MYLLVLPGFEIADVRCFSKNTQKHSTWKQNQHMNRFFIVFLAISEGYSGRCSSHSRDIAKKMRVRICYLIVMEYCILVKPLKPYRNSGDFCLRVTLIPRLSDSETPLERL